MKILNQWKTEREGNDSWLKYMLSIIRKFDYVIIQLDEDHNGWNGKVEEYRSILLDPYEDIDETVDGIVSYVNDYSDPGDNDRMLEEVANAISNLGEEYKEISNKIFNKMECPKDTLDF